MASTIRLELVTPERLLLSEEVDEVVAPGKTELEKQTLLMRWIWDQWDFGHAQELYDLGHRENFFYLEHAMGLASSIGLGLAISRTLDLDQLLNRILELLFEWVEADRGCIMLMDPASNALQPKVRRTREGVDQHLEAALPLSMRVVRPRIHHRHHQ